MRFWLQWVGNTLSLFWLLTNWIGNAGQLCTFVVKCFAISSSLWSVTHECLMIKLGAWELRLPCSSALPLLMILITGIFSRVSGGLLVLLNIYSSHWCFLLPRMKTFMTSSVCSGFGVGLLLLCWLVYEIFLKVFLYNNFWLLLSFSSSLAPFLCFLSFLSCPFFQFSFTVIFRLC